MARRECFVSVDIEADGPIPGPHSMLSLGAAAFVIDWPQRANASGVDALSRGAAEPSVSRPGTFSANLETLPGAAGDEDTMKWWGSQPEAWAACRVSPRAPAQVMEDFAAWLRSLPGRPTFVAYPAGFDFTFVYWYLIRFTGKSPFSHAALDMKTMASTLLGTPFRDTSKRIFPARWRVDAPHTHVALDDAIEQGEVFCKMLIEARGRIRAAASAAGARPDP